MSYIFYSMMNKRNMTLPESDIYVYLAFEHYRQTDYRY